MVRACEGVSAVTVCQVASMCDPVLLVGVGECDAVKTGVRRACVRVVRGVWLVTSAL